MRKSISTLAIAAAMALPGLAAANDDLVAAAAAEAIAYDYSIADRNNASAPEAMVAEANGWRIAHGYTIADPNYANAMEGAVGEAKGWRAAYGYRDPDTGGRFASAAGLSRWGN